MSDLISRQAAIDAINKAFERVFAWDGTGPLGDKVLENVPPAQAEIITCIDCIHYTPLGKDKAWGRCSVHSSPTENQRICQSCAFCSWAERRTE